METVVCNLCGEPMPAGETMFKYHGYSGPCPKPPLPNRKFRKKPVVIEAVQFIGSNYEEIVQFSDGAISSDSEQRVRCRTLETSPTDLGHIVSLSDWIIKGVNGECYPCKPDIFQKTYEKVTQ